MTAFIANITYPSGSDTDRLAAIGQVAHEIEGGMVLVVDAPDIEAAEELIYDNLPPVGEIDDLDYAADRATPR